MRILDLTIRDFGVYRGTVAFDLKPRQGNIVIFGGKNGAGKTTLLEAIRLCLYGKRAISEQVTNKEYENYILEHMHQRRNTTSPTRYTSLSLHFEYAKFGGLHFYEITRAWKKQANTTKEQLIIKEDGRMLTEMAEERWQDFIDDIVPPGIARLFFFDGEKIQSLASDKLSEQSLGEEVKQLLGLNLIERLQADLDIYKYHQRKENAVPELAEKLDKMQKERDAIEEEFLALRQDRSQIHSLFEFVQGKIDALERQISQESSGYAFQRKELEQCLIRLVSEIDLVEREIRSLVSGLLPFTLVPEMVEQLKHQLEEEARYQQWQAFNKILSPRLKQIKQNFGSETFWNEFDVDIQSETRLLINQQIEQTLVQLLNVPERFSDFSLLHQVSELEQIQLLGWIDQVTNEVPKKAYTLGEQLEKLTLQREKTAVELRKVPDNEILKPLVSNLNELYERRGQLTERENQQLEEENRLRNLLEDSNRQLRKAYDAFRGGETQEKRLELVQKVQLVLDGFLEQLTQEKITELEKLLVARFRELCRKPDLVYRISIDPQDFKITLYGEKDRIVPKERLSAGEKQMLAISILWALRQLSRRPFPIVIDTPLGRLDSDHRTNLIEQYFPTVSHQVILFSTDTEVDQVYFKALKPYISHAYHLEYDTYTGATIIQEGYFWNED